MAKHKEGELFPQLWAGEDWFSLSGTDWLVIVTDLYREPDVALYGVIPAPVEQIRYQLSTTDEAWADILPAWEAERIARVKTSRLIGTNMRNMPKKDHRRKHGPLRKPR